MSRPHHGKKGRTLPMSSMNGDSPGASHVPPNLEWEGEPITVFNCSQHISHMPGCNQGCGETIIDTELEVEAINEGRIWARQGMSFRGLPAVLMNVPFSGIQYDGFDLLCWVVSINKVLVENGIASVEEINQTFLEEKLRRMKELREQWEPEIKERRTRVQLGLRDKPNIIGPDGKPMG